jgi:hypothetical protein
MKDDHGSGVESGDLGDQAVERRSPISRTRVGRLTDRASLSPLTFRAEMCCRSWLRLFEKMRVKVSLDFQKAFLDLDKMSSPEACGQNEKKLLLEQESEDLDLWYV